MHLIRRYIMASITLVTMTAAFAFAFTATASAAVRPHSCGVSEIGALNAGGAVTASGYTSCSFAKRVTAAYDRGQPWQHHAVGLQVYSQVTSRSYHVTCRVPHVFMNGDEVHCTS
jgi:hypothetical protein